MLCIMFVLKWNINEHVQVVLVMSPSYWFTYIHYCSCFHFAIGVRSEKHFSSKFYFSEKLKDIHVSSLLYYAFDLCILVILIQCQSLLALTHQHSSAFYCCQCSTQMDWKKCIQTCRHVKPWILEQRNGLETFVGANQTELKYWLQYVMLLTLT